MRLQTGADLFARGSPGFFHTQITCSVRAMGLVKVLVVVATIMLLVILAFAYLARGRSNARRICCNCNLKQIGLSARMWSNEHGDAFPWEVPMSSNGVKEIAMSGNIAAMFLVMSNELNSPKPLFCPGDKTRTQQSDFSKLTNTNISYFIGLDARETEPQSILSGDRKLSGGVFSSNRVMQLWTTNVPVWDADIHGNLGNVGLGDGSAQQLYNSGLQKQFAAHQEAIRNRLEPKIRLALP